MKMFISQHNRKRALKHLSITSFGSGQHWRSLQHERQVNIAVSIADINAAVDTRLRYMEERVTKPQETS